MKKLKKLLKMHSGIHWKKFIVLSKSLTLKFTPKSTPTSPTLTLPVPALTF
jgi:hypothetical protein